MRIGGGERLALREGVKYGGANRGHIVSLPRRAGLQAIAAQFYGLFGRQHAGRLHMAMRHAFLVNRGERPHQGLCHLAPFVCRQRLHLQHIRETLLNVFHDGINQGGVVDLHLANVENADQVGMLDTLRSLQPRRYLICIGERLGQADGCGGAGAGLRLKPGASSFGPYQPAQRIAPIDRSAFQLIPKLHSVLCCPQKVRV